MIGALCAPDHIEQPLRHRLLDELLAVPTQLLDQPLVDVRGAVDAARAARQTTRDLGRSFAVVALGHGSITSQGTLGERTKAQKGSIFVLKLFRATPIAGPSALNFDRAAEEDVADADRFKDGLLAIVTPPGTPESAMDYALAIGVALEASPLFIAAEELDVLMAAVRGLTVLTSAALMQTAANAPSWRDLQRIAGRPFLIATLGATEKPTERLAAEMMLNREHLVARLDALSRELFELRRLLEGDDRQALTARLREVVSAREAWIAARLSEAGGPVEGGASEVRQRGLLEMLFGSAASRRKRDDKAD